jgi:hypothetical protein
MADETTTTQADSGATPPPATFDDFLATQPETVRALADTYAGGLKKALNAEREERKTLAGQLREATTKAEQGSAMAKTLEEITGKLDATEKRAVFFEAASMPAVGCVNPRAAFLVASAEGLFKKNGEPDWAALQATVPELFRKPGQANAGAGTGTPPPAKGSMNDYIRRAAGRG